MLRSTLTPKSRAHAPRRVSLSGGTRKNAPSKTLDEFSNLMMKTALDTAVDLITAARNESANGRLKRDTMAGILNVLPPDCSKHMIYNRERKRRRVDEEILDTTIDVPELEPVDVPELEPALNKGGRPLGATNEAKHDREEREDMAKAHVVKVLLARWAERKPGKRTERNELKLIIEAAKEKFNVHNLIIGESMIRQRANTGKTLTRRGGVSPMLEIEPLLVIFVICLQRIGTPLNPTSFLALANSLIEGTPLEKKVLESKNGGKIGAANGTRYYMGFMKRNKDEIDSKCPRKFPADRKNWTPYPNIDSMFRGKTVPCYTTASPHGGITGEILTDLLKFMDGLELFPRVENGPRPVLLLDGHNSRFNLAFLQYVNDPKTKWFVVIGLPYGTHVWQVGDSSEQNGSFNNAFYEALEMLFARKLKTGMPATISKTDIIPLVNM
jgi:hypothetical protein